MAESNLLDDLLRRLTDAHGPVLLATKGMKLPPSPGLYVVSCGPCVAHIGTSGTLSARVGTLARLGTASRFRRGAVCGLLHRGTSKGKLGQREFEERGGVWS